MKKRLLGILIICCIIFNVINYQYEKTVLAGPTDIVNIPDTNLLTAINIQLGRGEVTTPVTEGDMASITSLSASSRNIVSLEGMQYMTNLKYLYIADNQISDLAPISGLVQLQRLYLDINNISSVEPLNTLVNLEELTLAQNKISDISWLSSLSNLYYLHLASNAITDVSPVSNLIKLNHLDFYDNQISNISSLSQLINLEQISLGKNKISDIGVVSNFSKLKVLGININFITDFSPAKDMYASGQLEYMSGVTQLVQLPDMIVGEAYDFSVIGLELEKVPVAISDWNTYNMQYVNNQIVPMSQGQVSGVFLKSYPNTQFIEINVRVVANAYFGSTFTITKEDAEDGALLSGATFEIVNSAGQVVDTVVTGSDGKVVTKKVVPGTYTIRETIAPTGYDLKAETQTMTIGDSENRVLTFKNSKTVVPPTPILGKVTVEKRDKDTHDLLIGASYRVVNLDTGEEKIFDSSNSNTVVVTDIPVGKYMIEEVKAPIGYNIDSTPQYFEVNSENRTFLYTFFDTKIKTDKHDSEKPKEQLPDTGK